MLQGKGFKFEMASTHCLLRAEVCCKLKKSERPRLKARDLFVEKVVSIVVFLRLSWPSGGSVDSKPLVTSLIKGVRLAKSCS